MKNKLLLSAFVVLLFCCNSIAQTYIPIATTGYSLDGVAENTTAVSTTGGALDASDFVLYSQFYGTIYTTGYGLPNNGIIASGTRTYQLQSYTGYNVMHILAGFQDSLNFVTPTAFPAISLLGFGTQGAATASITVRFTDNTTQIFTPINMDDWFTANPAVYSGFDRCLRTTGVAALVGGAGNPRMFGIDLSILCANQGKAISRIIIRNNSVSAQICVLAVAGNPPAYTVTTNPSLLCGGSTATLSGNGLTSYTWQAVGNFAGSNSGTVTVNPPSTTIYTLNGTSGGCPTYTTVVVNVSSGQPVLSLSGSTQSVCLGAPATITASGALAYTITNQAVNGVPFTPTATTVYTVTGANGCGAVSQTISITVAPLVISVSTPTALVCAGYPATLTAAGATNYTWMPGSSNQTVYVLSPQASAIYTVTGKTGNCLGTNTIALATTPVPTLAITASSSSICDGGSVTMVVTGNALTYSWSTGNQTSTTITVTPNQLSLYTVTGTNSANCANSTFQLITVNPNPTVTATASNPTVCSGGTSGLTAIGAASYSWNTVAGGPAIFVNPLTTTVYTLTGSMPTGCSSSSTVLVTVFLPTLSVSANTTICKGGAVGISAGTAVSYVWSNNLPGAQSVTVNPTSTTIYTVTGSIDNQNGLICPADNTVQVTVNPNPTITAVSNHTSNTICKGESAVLTASGAGSSGTYTWTGAVSSVNTATTSVTPTTVSTYTFKGTNSNGCIGSGQISLFVVTCTGIETYAANPAGILAYPNPAQGLLNIKSEVPVELMIINVQGQTVRSLTLNDANGYHLTVEGLSDGIYFITSVSNNIVFRQKIVIAR